jgi:HK97 family phage prohead protease
MPKCKDREYREFDARQLELRKLEDGQDVVEGYATTFGEPYLLWDDGDYRMFESVDAHAYDDCDMSDVIMQYNHEGRVFARGGNKTLEVMPDSHGLHIRGYLGGTEIGRQLLEEIRGGYTTKMSQGFRVAKDERKVVEDRENNRVDIYRTILKVQKLYDVSAVSLPANDATEINARSFCEGVIAEVRGEIAAEQAKARIKEQIKIIAGGI